MNTVFVSHSSPLLVTITTFFLETERVVADNYQEETKGFIMQNAVHMTSLKHVWRTASHPSLSAPVTTTLILATFDGLPLLRTVMLFWRMVIPSRTSSSTRSTV